MAIDEYEVGIVNEVLGLPNDFEVDRFSHSEYDGGRSDINYEFYFHNNGSLDNLNSWQNSYLSNGFISNEVYYYSSSFANSSLYKCGNRKIFRVASS